METLSLSPDHARLALGAMRAVARANGETAPHEQTLLDAAADALGVAPDDPRAEAPTPATLAAQITDAPTRERLVQALVIMALIDGAAEPVEVDAIARYADALGVDEPRVRNLRQLAAGRVHFMWMDLARRSFARATFGDALREEGPRGVWKIVAPMVGLGRDYELARRYIELGALPHGTLGRAYWEFITSNGFGFPGEPGAVAERGVWHDLSHVLSGYGTDPDGEVQVVSFIAGYRREDPFFWLFTIALQFHLGVRVSPYSPGGVKWRFDPARVIRAVRRGMALTRDLSVGWDYWPELARPLDEVRRALNVPPP